MRDQRARRGRRLDLIRPLMEAAMLLTVAGGLASFPLEAQQGTQRPAPPSRPSSASSTMKEGMFVGVASCAGSGCHGSTQPLKATDVLQNEYFTWLNRDKHAQAYNVLFSDRSARVARNMKLRGKAFEERICLECHSTWVPESRQAVRLDREDGVQCEACHGPSGGWRSQHTDSGWTHADSVKAGMRDLRSIDVRGSLCLTCHQGDSSKSVDHELIAAGHPILTFELDNYSESMPPHWMRFEEKRNREGMRDTHGVRQWATGQAVAFREGLEALAHHARGDKWPEFAVMSCFNCHHDLKSSLWRQERGYRLRAGLPAWSPQRWAVLKHVVAASAPAERAALEQNVSRLAAAVAKMNDPKAVSDIATATARIIDRVIPQIEAVRWDQARVRKMMATIAADRESLIASDIHSAEQAALALQSLATYLAREDPQVRRGAMMQTIDELFKELEDQGNYDPNRFAQRLERLQAQVR